MSLPLIIGLIAIVGIILAIFFVKRLILLAVNSIIGLLALMGWNILFPLQTLKINFLSVLIVALSGIFGFIGVVVLHFLGVYF
jgi:hypothetical protein